MLMLGGIYLFKSKNAELTLFGKDGRSHIIKEIFSQGIGDYRDWEMAKLKYKRLQKNHE